jgi:hypothetical protein
MSIKKMFVGEKMPDKNDPKYRERYEREVNYGRRFADKTGISWMARKLQQIADSHRCGFLVVVFGIVLLCFFFNFYRMVSSYKAGAGRKGVAVERVDSALQKKNVHVHELPDDYVNPYLQTEP